MFQGHTWVCFLNPTWKSLSVELLPVWGRLVRIGGLLLARILHEFSFYVQFLPRR